jgi:carbon-monoxide dehydrogenase large subunit
VNERYGQLLTGGDAYAGDIRAPGTVHLAFVRAPVPHARIAGVDVEAARAAPGVVGVFTASDLGLHPRPPLLGDPARVWPALAEDVVRYVGEAVVAVAAESKALAVDAAELVIVGYDELDAPGDPADAARPGAPPLFAGTTTNVVLDLPSTGALLDGGDLAVHLELDVARVAVAPMEGHATLAVPQPDGRLVVWLSTQVPHSARLHLARALGCAPADLRVIAPRVGGAFGGKAGGAVPEHEVAVAVARRLGRPVRYTEDRSENLLSMQGRGVHQEVELRARRDGTLTGLRARITADLGAYVHIAAIEPYKMRLMASGPYRIPEVDFGAQAVVTNRAPVGAYRGPGRSEAAGLLERSLDVLARELGLDPVEIRRRNLLRADELPCTNPTGMTYDSGDFHRLLDEVTAAVGYAELRADQARRRAAGGRLLGIGVATVVDSTAWAARSERAHVVVARDGRVEVRLATASAGQEHGQAFAALAARLLPVAPDDVLVLEGDTDVLEHGDGTMGSRSAQLAGAAVHRATEDVAAQARHVAAELLEAAVEDVVVHGTAGFGVRGVPSRVVRLAEIAAATPALEARCLYEQDEPTHPAAAHVSVVEVDVETGRVTPLRHVAVTDAGTVLDLVSARGQVVGASAQGIAQALYEEVVYDGAVPLGLSLAEYAVPSAADLPPIGSLHVETASPVNPLGAKGIGEIGMVGAPAAVQNAVVDALAHLGVRHVAMPCTPERVWRAIRDASGYADAPNDVTLPSAPRRAGPVERMRSAP